MSSDRPVLTILTLLLLFTYNRSGAQLSKEGSAWVQGSGLTFLTSFGSSGPPVNQIIKPPPSFLYFIAGHSNICDSNGQPVIVCDGYNLYRSNLELIEDGDTIVPSRLYEEENGFSSYTQSSIILPFKSKRFLVVTPTASDSEVINYWDVPSKKRVAYDLLLYHEVDMNLNGGAGKVTKRMVPILSDVLLSKTQMMACRHGDGSSWWLLKQAYDTNVVYKFLFSEDSVYGPYIQGFTEPHTTFRELYGQATFSKDGSKYATLSQNGHKLFLADFDRCNGNLSNPRLFDVPPQLTQNPTDPTERDSSTCGVCFSPNGRFLYVNGFFNVQQLDLQDSNPNTVWTHLSGIDTSWSEFQAYSDIYPGPDGKLYIGNISGFSGQMSVIDEPDKKGTAAGFCRKCLRFPGHLSQGQTRFAGVHGAPCMPNYQLGATSPICYPGGVRPSPKVAFSVYPNPSNGDLTVEYSVPGQMELYDLLGRRVSSWALPESISKVNLTVSGVAAGVYGYRYQTRDSGYLQGKLVVVPR